MTGAHWSRALRKFRACAEAVTWAATQPDAATAWATCERADWLLWIAGRLATTAAQRKAVVLAACACARTALRHVPPGEDRPRVALETAEAWCRGEATIEQVRAHRTASASAAAAAAFAAADAYASAAYADAASASAAFAAADAADADAAYAYASAFAAASADASAASAYASAAAADRFAYAAAFADAADAAAADAFADAARATALRDLAQMVRQHLPCPTVQS